MNRKDENYLRMARAVQTVLNRHEAVWTNMARFKTAKETLDALIANADDLNSKSNIDTRGATEDKTNAEAQAVDLTLDLCDRAQVYAQDIKDMELWRQLEVSNRDLTSIADSATLAMLRNLHERMDVIADKINDYGVSKDDLAQLKTYIDAFEEGMPRTRDLTVQRKGYNTSLPMVIRDIRSNFRILDRLVNIWKNTELETQYWDARIVIDLRGSKGDDEVLPTV